MTASCAAAIAAIAMVAVLMLCACVFWTAMQCACVLMDLVDPNLYLTMLPDAMKKVEKEFNKPAIVALYDTVDFIGISSYAGESHPWRQAYQAVVQALPASCVCLHVCTPFNRCPERGHCHQRPCSV